MSEDLLRSLLSLFAIISNADGKLDEREIMYINSFMEDYLGKEYAKKYRRLFIKYFHYTNRQPVSEEVITEICTRINQHLDRKQKFIAMIRLLEISVFNEDYRGYKREITASIASKMNINEEEFIYLENFVYATSLNNLFDHGDLVVYTNKITDFACIKTEKSQFLDQTDICFLRNENADMFLVKFMGKENEVLLNFNVVKNNLIYVFYLGNNIKTNSGFSVHFSDISALFTQVTIKEKFTLNASDLCYKFEGGSIGIEGVNIFEESGRLVAIMGSSGSGKTSLLNVLSGINKPSSGSVKINDFDINSKEGTTYLKGFIGYVAQEDVLIAELTVYQNLYFNAQLCFKDLSDEKIKAKVHKTLRDLGIYHIKDLKVGDSLNKKISGGQRKRLNIALELIREPAILLLDEPTSGLSSKDSENVMDFLKQLTYRGKLIITVIHQPSTDIYKMFDSVVIMDKGGYQIYYGKPMEAIQYFKSNSRNIKHQLSTESLPSEYTNPELIFNIVEEEFVDEYGNYTGTRKLDPIFWKNLFQKQKKDHVPVLHGHINHSLNTPNRDAQFRVFLKRDILSKLGNRQYLAINLLVAPLLALILSFIVRYTEDFSGTYHFSQNENIPAYIFISIIVSLFMGMTVSAGEIVKDQKLLKREKFLHLSRLSYLSAKLSVLFVLSAIQSLLFILIANRIVELKGMNAYYGFALFSTSCFANILGLMISSAFRSTIAVYIAIPLLLIPQMILSGAVFHYDKLNKIISSKEKVPVLADFMVARWTYEALVVHQYKNNKFQRPFFELDRKQSIAYYKYAYWTEHLLKRANELKLIIIEKPEGYQHRVDQIVNLMQTELLNEKIYRYDSDDFKLLKKGNYEEILLLIHELSYMKEFYNRQYRMYNRTQDNMVVNYLKTPEHKIKFTETRKAYFNYAISNLARNKNSLFKIQEYDNRLIQKVDPIYRTYGANTKWYEYRTHFFCPEKNVLGFMTDTYWANMLAIWVINIISFIFLYSNIIKSVVYPKVKFR